MVKVPEVAVFCSEVRVVPTVNVFVVRYENDDIWVVPPTPPLPVYVPEIIRAIAPLLPTTLEPGWNISPFAKVFTVSPDFDWYDIVGGRASVAKLLDI